MLTKKLASIVLICVLFSACGNTGSIKKRVDQPNTKLESGTPLLTPYKNSKFNIGLQVPKDWVVIEKQDHQTGKTSINMYMKEAGALIGGILGVNEGMRYSYIAIWPQGLGTELPPGQLASFKTIEDSLDLSFEVNRIDSKLMVLENESVWGYFIVPKTPPESWSNYGFIYAQIQVVGNETICFDKQTGQKKPIKQCDYLSGDKIIQTGRLNKKEEKAIQNILETIEFIKVRKETAAGDSI